MEDWGALRPGMEAVLERFPWPRAWAGQKVSCPSGRVAMGIYMFPPLHIPGGRDRQTDSGAGW